MNKERKCVKAHKQSLKRYQRNKSVKSATRTAIKRALVVMSGGAGDEAVTAVRNAQRAVDVAARKKVITKKTAARRKSRLARRLNKTLSSTTTTT